jgi:large subunit ribosomal protein LP0
MSNGKESKIAYFNKLTTLFEAHSKILIVQADNIGAAHLSKVRKGLRGTATILMGKNTMMRKAIRNNAERAPKWGSILPNIVGNIGLVFTNGDLAKVRDTLVSSRVPASAKAGMIAPQAVQVPKGQTSLEPTKTSFLQALNIASKINKGTIEILNDVNLIKAGEKIGPSEAQLLQMLDIRPFTYGLEVLSVYDDGAVYDVKVLDLKDNDLLTAFSTGVAQVAALSLATHSATTAAFPHVVLNGYKNLLAIAASTEFVFKQAEKLKEMLKNPGAFKAAAPAPTASAPAPTAGKKEEPKKEEKKEEKPESEDMGFDLFG